MLINSFKLIIACKVELPHEMNTNVSFSTVQLLSDVFQLWGLLYIPAPKQNKSPLIKSISKYFNHCNRLSVFAGDKCVCSTCTAMCVDYVQTRGELCSQVLVVGVNKAWSRGSFWLTLSQRGQAVGLPQTKNLNTSLTIALHCSPKTWLIDSLTNQSSLITETLTPSSLGLLLVHSSAACQTYSLGDCSCECSHFYNNLLWLSEENPLEFQLEGIKVFALTSALDQIAFAVIMDFS